MSVAAGTIQIKPKIFLTTVLLSAITWSGGLVLTGRLLGPYWKEVVKQTGVLQFIGIIILLVITLLFVGKHVSNKLLLARESKRV